jgi:hypothetical protein
VGKHASKLASTTQAARAVVSHSIDFGERERERIFSLALPLLSLQHQSGRYGRPSRGGREQWPEAREACGQ